MFVSVCVQQTHLSQEKYWLEFFIGGQNCILQPYIDSATALSDRAKIVTSTNKNIVNIWQISFQG